MIHPNFFGAVEDLFGPLVQQLGALSPNHPAKPPPLRRRLRRPCKPISEQLSLLEFLEIDQAALDPADPLLALLQQPKEQDVQDILSSTDRCAAVLLNVFERNVRDIFEESQFLRRSTATWLATADKVRVSDGVRQSPLMPAFQVSFTPHWYLAAVGVRYQDWLDGFKADLLRIARRKVAVERCTPQQARTAYLAIKRAHVQKVFYVSSTSGKDHA